MTNVKEHKRPYRSGDGEVLVLAQDLLVAEPAGSVKRLA